MERIWASSIIGIWIAALGLQACGRPQSPANSAAPVAGASAALVSALEPPPVVEWTKTVYTSANDEELVTVARDFPFPAQHASIRAVLVCEPRTQRLRLALESYELTDAGIGAAAAFSRGSGDAVQGTAQLGATAPVPLAELFAFDRFAHVIAATVPGAVEADHAPFRDPPQRHLTTAGERLRAALPMRFSVSNSHGSFEVLVPADVTAIDELAAACSGAPAPAPQLAATPRPVAPGVPEPAATPAPLATPGTFRTSFDCALAHSVAEQLICTTPALAAADLALAEYYRRNLAASNEATVGPSQRAFITLRNQCRTPACITKVYRDRHEELSALGFLPE